MRLPPAYCGFFLFALTLAIGFGGAHVFSDPDTAWHIATGDLIRQLHYIPFEDPWSFAAVGEVWYNLSWLFDITFSALFAAGGFSLLYVVTLLAFAGTFVFMAHHCVTRGASLTAVSIALFLALLISFSSILARPNLCSIMFTVMFYHLLCCYRDKGRTRAIAALPFLMAFWVNMHGGFLLAFPIMGVFLLEAMLAKKRDAMRAYGAIIALCMAATLLNPYGYGVYYGAYKTLSLGFDKIYITEWQAAKIGSDIPLTLLLLVMLFAGNMYDKRIALSDRLLAIALLFMALSSMRHGAVAAALTMPYVSLRLTSVLAASRWGAKLAAKEAAIMADMHKTDIKWMGAIMAAIAVGLLASPFPRDMLLKEPLGFPKKSFPAAEAAFIEQHYPNLRFMTDYNIGGYLDYIWRGRVKVFVDGRASSLFSKDTLQDYADFEINGRGYGGKAKAIALQYKFDGAVIPNDDPASGDWHWNPDWKLVYQGDVAAVYLKADNSVKPKPYAK